MDDEPRTRFGKMLKQQRVVLSLTLMDLAAKSGISASHLGRIERGERFPSAQVLKQIAKPLSFDVDQLFTMAGYLTPKPGEDGVPQNYGPGQIDPYVARILAEEPVEIQRSTIGILSILKNMTKTAQTVKSSNDQVGTESHLSEI